VICVKGTLGSSLVESVDYMYLSEPEGYEMHSMEFFYYYGDLLRLPSRVTRYFLSWCVARCGGFFLHYTDCFSGTGSESLSAPRANAK